MLWDSGRSQSWSAEAAATVTYNGNFVPHKWSTRTPHEAIFGTKLDVEHLHVFGCSVWVLVPEELRRKLTPLAPCGTFLSYGQGQESWRILVSRQVQVSRVVRF